MSEVRLNLIVLRSTDLDRAARFYGLIGIDFVREKHGPGPEHLASNLGEVVLEIYPDASAGEGPRVRIGFEVPSVEDAINKIREDGSVVLTPAKESPWGLRAVVADPDGHGVELRQRKS